MVGWCNVCHGGIPYVRVVYCVIGCCYMCHGGVLCGRVVW